jgi:DMSO reductase anchor subunit
MHPAPSVILFSTLSGLGFGLLVFLGLGLPTVTGWTAFIFYLIAYLLAVGGLVASTFHLGHPERALKAFTQWRSSWLSREAWLAVLALIVMALYAACAVFFGTVITPLGWIGAALCVATVVSTAMIYTQMKTVPRWNQWATPALLIAVSLAGGALLAGQTSVAAVLLALAGVLQVQHWHKGDEAFAASGTDLSTATGLGTPGNVRSFERPHTGGNYLLHEMAYVVARSHAEKLRWLALALGYAAPVVLILSPGPVHLLGGLAVLSHLLGILASRWLFFAEAKHVVSLYYGAG